MTADDFVAALVRYVYAAGVADVLAQAAAPSGRRPPPRELAVAAWYGALTPDAQALVAHLVRQGAHATLFGVLAVLDGARQIDPARGHLELAYVARDGTRTVLNAPSSEPLHDRFQAAVHDDVFGPPDA